MSKAWLQMHRWGTALIKLYGVDVNPCLNQFQCINTQPVITINKQTCLSLTRLKNLAGPLAFTH